MRRFSRFALTLFSAAALTFSSMSFAFAEGDEVTGETPVESQVPDQNNGSDAGAAGTALDDSLQSAPSSSLQGVGLMAAPVAANGPTLRAQGAAGANEFVYTPVRGTKGDANLFYKYLTMDKEANVPNTTFEFTIEAGTAIPATATTLAVYAGKVTNTNMPAISKAEFKVNDTTYESAEAEYLYIDGTNTLPQGKKYAKAGIQLDFSNVSFSEPGVYRYVIKELTVNSNYNQYHKMGITNEQIDTKYLDVYVIDNNGVLEIAQYALHTNPAAPKLSNQNGSGDASTPGGRLADKVAGYGNDYDTSNLTVKKEVAGNQASKDKYFKFTVKLNGTVPGTKYDIELNGENAKAVATPTKTEATTITETMVNPTTITTDSSGGAEFNVYLQHGQYIRIDGLAKGTGYTVTEDAEDYLSTPMTGAGFAAATGTVASEDLTTGYINTRNGNVPTGVIVEFGPYIIGAVVILLALMYVLTNKKRRAI